MIQHFEGKERVDIKKFSEELGKPESEKTFANKVFLNFPINNEFKHKALCFERCTFSKVTFNRATIKNMEFTHCVFIDCFFRETTFKVVDFSNVTFINCSFYNMKIENTNFFYTEWDNSYIKYNEIKDSLPSRHNSRKRLCKTMARNSLDAGNINDYKAFFFEARKASDQEYISRIFRKEEYYKENYNFYDSVKSLGRLIFSKLNWAIWGYGEKIQNVVISSMFVIFLFAMLHMLNPAIDNLESSKFISSLYLSICSFITLSPDPSLNVETTDFVFRYLISIEGLIGIAFMGVFTAALFRNVSYR